MNSAADKYTGYIDTISNDKVIGWAITKDQEVPTFLNILIDGRVVATIECSHPRDDVHEAGHKAPAPGFAFLIPPEFRDGVPHHLRVEFLNGVPLHFAGDETGQVERLFRFVQEYVFKGYVDRFIGDTVSGWVIKGLSEVGPWLGGQNVAIFCGKQLAGQVEASEYRPDVAEALDCDPGCGFSFQIPHRFLGEDATELLVETFPQRWVVPGSPTPFQRAPGLARARLKEMQARLDKLALETWHIQRELQSLTAENYVPLGSYDNWAVGYYNDLRRRAPTIPDGTDNQPLVTIICPVYRPRLPDFVTAIRSVLCQTYPHWELIIVDDNSQQEELASIISELTNMDKRIRVVRHAQNLGISEATNTAIRAAQGDFIAFFDHDDMLVDVALQYSLAYLLQHQGAFCYSDEDKIDDFGRLSEPNFKSDWNLRLVLAQNYVCHFLVVRRDLVEKVGYFKTEYDGAQDHDYVMRLSEHVAESSIIHIPEVLYHWRKTPDSTATTVANKQYAIDAGVKAVQDYMDRSGALAKVRSRGAMTNYIIDWVLDQHPSVSIIIPFKDNVSVTSKCVDGVLANTDYENFEVVLVDNYSMQAATDDFKVSIASNSRVRIVNANVSFNYSLINNLAVETCRSEVIAFLNNDVFISDPSWLSQMLGELFWKSDIGAVGCKLLYESGTVQHAGVILGVGHGGVADHPFRGLESNDPGYMGRALCSQELSAVTAACLVCRKSLFDEAGGFDARELPVAYNDIDLCLKIRKKGRKIIWRAETIATHAESASRSSDLDQARLPRLIGENQVMKQRWGQILANDPYYHRLFSRERGIFQYLGSRGDVIPLL